ncbi:MAG: murein biosynthesis integral membrane protein MurJ [Sphingomonadales bacterium]|jgi:putative peptidoglycan lipid II flippase|nr:murein biosynthesis integral membrane protein MurJ [Sphingomonadales bacterium]MBK9004003.1 murein biosynthesis integral membrane protein MurJ [Sphingomonadales bacterium]MBK9269178.1 murein biosynthesis integral membrane protein MurJ [Sphingomonadales bacterium]MBP6434172.1 murein biosynthesis integral membrane protein MurJ [Sphingorhabdus sp.]
MNLLKSTGIIGGMTLISRIFGFARDMMLSRLLGASAVGDAWQLAFQLPNIFRRLFAEGAFSAAFVPLFNRKAAEDGSSSNAAAQRFSNEVLSVFIPILLVFSAIMIAIMPWVIWLIDDFGAGGRTNATSISLARITFPYLGLISIMTLFAAILNSISKFAAAAFAPVLLNICMITAMLVAIAADGGSNPEQTAMMLAWSVSFAGIIQMLWLWYWAHRAGFRFRLQRPGFTPDVRELGVLILPAVFGAGIYQISRFIDLFFLGRLEEGSFVFLALADRLNQLPLGIIGIALGTAILPALSRFIAQNDAGGAQRVQSNAIELGLLLTVPAAVGLFCAAQPLVSAFYFGGKFGTDDVTNTAAVVAMLVIGLPAYVLVKVLTPGFFARKDTKTPVYTAGVSLAINIALNLSLIPLMGVAGLALAGALAAWANCIMLYAILHRRDQFTIEPDLFVRIGRILLSAAAMGGVIWFLAPYGNAYYGAGVAARISSILVLVGSGAIVYFGLAWVTGAIDRSKIAMLTRKQAAN